MNRRLFTAVALVASSFAAPASAQVDPYDAGSYYDNISGTGMTLMNSLEARLKLGHQQTTYGAVRYILPLTDEDPNDAGRMLLVYTRESNDDTWQSGNYESREHVWPASRQGINGNNGTAGRYGDVHMLKPAEQSINSERSNLSFGLDTTSGSARQVGAYFYPGDADKGDVSRIAFYAATRWEDDGLKLVEGTGNVGNREMGDLSSLVRWHYEDAPDTFERRRNDVIHDFYTNNRNAYIDRPEYVWSVFVDQENDTSLSLAGGTTSADGSSSLDVDFGKVLLGSTLDATQTVTLNKTGFDGTYYSVTADGDAISSVNGRYNAFVMGGNGSQQIDVSLPADAAAMLGTTSGTVTIDNLDVTTQGGVGRGDNDGNDTINLSATTVVGSNASFAADLDDESLTLDFGIIGNGLGDLSLTGDVFNLDAFNVGSAFVAGLDLDGATFLSGDNGVFTATADADDIAAGMSGSFLATLTDNLFGSFSAIFGIGTSDADNVLGGGIGEMLTLNLTGEVRLAGDANGDGTVSILDFALLRGNFGSGDVGFEGGDFNRDGTVSILDFAVLRANFGGTTQQFNLIDAWAATVPEPTALLMLSVGGLLALRRR